VGTPAPAGLGDIVAMPQQTGAAKWSYSSALNVSEAEVRQ